MNQGFTRTTWGCESSVYKDDLGCESSESGTTGLVQSLKRISYIVIFKFEDIHMNGGRLLADVFAMSTIPHMETFLHVVMIYI